MKMRKRFLFLPFLLLLVSGLVSCEEVEDEGKYYDWQARNEAYIDSIKNVAGDRYVATEEGIRAVEVGEMFILQDYLVSTDKHPRYIYCKKLVKNAEGEIPVWTEAVNAFYYGTLITGEKFDGGFDGYGALDQNIPNPPGREPPPFSWSTDFLITESTLRTGWKIFLQYMAVGERWLVYLPTDSAYGSEGSGTIPGYSALVFDVVLNKVIE